MRRERARVPERAGRSSLAPGYQSTLLAREPHFLRAQQQRAQQPWLHEPASSEPDEEPLYHAVPQLYEPHEYKQEPASYAVAVHEQDSNSSTREYGGGTGRRQRPQPSPAPSDLRGPPDLRAPGGCGGHCPGFEYVCYYVLQIIFVVGMLTGISLCIAGSVLRRSNRGGDLGVLVYIGCLAFLVCSLLLGVQCCVRRSTEQRCKQLRLRAAPPDCIPLDAIPSVRLGENSNITVTSQAIAAGRQLQPLIYPSGLTVTSTLPQIFYRSEERHHIRSSSIDEVNGVPWWRRQ